jgi:hypothetical protein
MHRGASACTTVKQSLTSQNATQTPCKQLVRNESKTVSYSGVIGGVLARLAYECALEVISVALDTSKSSY